jgi:glycosyltransferase involved in cell wall biosynthesis
VSTDLRRLAVLALTPYPIESANTRFRLAQFVPALASHRIDVTYRPFVDPRTFRRLYDRKTRGLTALGLLAGAARRVGDIARARRADVMLVLREAVIGGPPVVEALAAAIGRIPLVLDLDDPTWVGYRSPTHGRVATLVRRPGKTEALIDRAAAVTCGSQGIADVVAGRGTTAVLLPPSVDMGVFRPRRASPPADPPVVGWIGTHSTYPYLADRLPALAEVARERSFRLRVVGAGPHQASAGALDVEWREWHLATEPDEFAALDVGLYPLPAGDAWAAGKAGLKSVQYLASGVPFVASPVGGAGEIGVPGATHLEATTLEDWQAALHKLLADPALRAALSSAGREHAVAHHTHVEAAAVLADVLRAAAR